LLFALTSTVKTTAQGSAPLSHNCGVFQKLGGIPDGYSGQIYYDRFGHAWSEDEITNGNVSKSVSGQGLHSVVKERFISSSFWLFRVQGKV